MINFWYLQKTKEQKLTERNKRKEGEWEGEREHKIENTIVKEIICIILHFLADSLKKETDEINFNVRFYLDQYIQTLI